MNIELEISCSSSELISRGRLVCRCYRRVNDAIVFGRPAGHLICTQVIARRQEGGGISYHVVLSDYDPETSTARRPPESADFSCLEDDWTVDQAKPAEPPPSLRWDPAPVPAVNPHDEEIGSDA